MAKRKISAQQVVQDIRGGMTDADIAEKYHIDPQGLQKLFDRLVETGLITAEELDGREGGDEGFSGPGAPARGRTVRAVVPKNRLRMIWIVNLIAGLGILVAVVGAAVINYPDDPMEAFKNTIYLALVALALLDIVTGAVGLVVTGRNR